MSLMQFLLSILIRAFHHVHLACSHCYAKFVFGSVGNNSIVIKPLRIIGGKNIVIGDDVTILNNARLETVSYYAGEKYCGKLLIGSGTSIEQNCHIIAADELSIGNNCMISSYVYIADCNHRYIIGETFRQSGLEILNTRVGDNVFIGIGARIMPGVKIGNNCVIGANSVVTKDVLDFSMVAGVPARVIKWYNFETNNWETLR